MDNDLISRKALKEELELSKYIVPTALNKLLNSEINRCIEAVNNAPAAEPEQSQGRWIKEDNGKTTDIYRCSICGRSILLCKGADLSKYPFCHCGAAMRGGEE